jgi:hypothetical protein
MAADTAHRSKERRLNIARPQSTDRKNGARGDLNEHYTGS